METHTASLWHRALHDSQLQDLPFKIETNAYGQLVLSPHKPIHSYLQMRLGELLRRYIDRPGRRAVELAVETPEGVKVPDVAWMSEERWMQIPNDAEASPVMPELCVEVLSEGNTEAEMAAKRQLYFETGAKEIWTCDADGHVRFFDPEGERSASAMAPSFPTSIE